jgi:two-component sensor histidine kinase
MIGQQNILLREGHHRIKNNLQLLASLISIRTTDENSQILKNEIVSRINAVATLEEQIHKAPFFGDIPLRSFVEQLIDGMREIRPDGEHEPRFRLHLNSVTIPIEYGPKIGVFLVELITNAYKHAFAGIEDPVIDLSVERDDENIVITFEDNGVGMSPERYTNSDSIGLQLLQQIEEDLGGTLEFQSDQGVTIRLSFPVVIPD